MKTICPILCIFLVIPALACRIDYPFEYLSPKSDVIIVGEIEKMDYDLPHEAPYDDMHYSLAYVKIKEVLKLDVDLKEKNYFTFRVASKKDTNNTATVYWDKGMKGTWFFQRDEDEPFDWMGVSLEPLELSEKVKQELSYSYQRKFGQSYTPWKRIEGTWPKGLGGETNLFELVLHLNLLALSGKSDSIFSLDGDLFSGLRIKKVDFDQPLIRVLRDICDQHDHLDFEFGDHQVVFFDRSKAESSGSINSVRSAHSVDTPHRSQKRN